MAVGLDPASLLELDGAMFDAVERAAFAHFERFSRLEHLVADLLELTHAHFVAFLAAHSPKGARMPPPLRVPRAQDGAAAKPVKLSPAQFAGEYGPARSASG